MPTMLSTIFLITFWTLVISSPSQVYGAKGQYATLLACEGDFANITCSPGTRINLIRANFGRFSISICNDQGNSAMQVNCISRTTFRVISDLCELKNECQVEATSAHFGDGCPGNAKYLEVHYQCISGDKVYRFGKPVTRLTTTQAVTTTPTSAAKSTPTSTTPSLPVFSGNDKAPPRGNRQNAITKPSISTKGSTNLKPNYASYLEESSPYQSSFPSSTPSSLYPSSSPSLLPSSNWPYKPPYDRPVQSLSPSSAPSTKSNTSSVTSSSSPSFNSHLSNGSALCPPVTSRGLFWNWTRPGSVVRQECPPPSQGWAKWFCSMDPFGLPVWIKPEADLSSCRSKWLIPVENRLRDEEPIIKIAFELVKGTKLQPLYGGDIAPIIDIVGQLISKVETGLEAYPGDKQFAFVQETFKHMLDICSNLLDDLHKDAWDDLSPIERTRSAAALISEFERITLVFMETGSSSGDYYQSSSNLYMSIHAHRLDQLPNGLRLPKENVDSTNNKNDNNKFRDQNAFDLSSSNFDDEADDKSNSIYLPRVSLNDLTRRNSNMIRIGYVVYSKMGPLLDPIISEPSGLLSSSSADSGLMTMLRMSERGDNNNVDLDNTQIVTNNNNNMDDNDQHIVATIVNSDVVGVLVPKDGLQMILLREPIEIVFRHLIIENITNARCVFWDSSQWSEFGCTTVSSNDTHTLCRCNHLTNFAVLVDFTRQEVTTFHGLILHGLIQISCIISSFCITICLITFIIFRNLRAERTFIHANLCLCLLAVELVFILGIDKVSLGTLCSILAASLHYSLLASFLWMLMEGIHLYYMLIEVFEPPTSRLPIYFITAYISPLTLIGLTLGLSMSPYGPTGQPGTSGSTQVCWISSSVILQSFVLPLALILSCNLVFLIIAQCAIYKHISTSFVHKEVKHQDKIKQIRLWVRGSLGLIFVLSLTWSLGIIYISFPGATTAYLFTASNVLQGVYIFTFQCLTNDKVRREYVRAASRCQWLSWLCCQMCSSFDGQKGSSISSSPMERATFFHPNQTCTTSSHQSSSVIQGTSTSSTKPSSSGSSAGGHGIPLSCPYPDSSCYPHETEEPMIGLGSAQLLSSSGRKIITTPGEGAHELEETSHLYDRGEVGDAEMETRALMEGLSHSDATTGPMRPIIMRSDVSLTRIPGEHLYECIPEDGSGYHNVHHHQHTNNLLHSSPLTGSSSQYQDSPYLHHNGSYHQYHSSLSSSSSHFHHHSNHNPSHSHHHYAPHPHPHHQLPLSEYQQLHLFINNKPATGTAGKQARFIRDHNRYNIVGGGGGGGTLDRRTTLQCSTLSNQRGSSDELLPAIIRDNTCSPYEYPESTTVVSATSQPQNLKEMIVSSSLSASSTASSASSSSSSSTNLPTTQLNIPVSPRSPHRSLGSLRKSTNKPHKSKTVFAKLKGNQIISTTGAINGEPC